MGPGFNVYMLSLAALVAVSSCKSEEQAPSITPEWDVVRSPTNPLLTTESEGMVAEHGYSDVNGPSVIRAPSWVEKPLGRYYMYFAHHRGSFIRLAYADSIQGPWTVWPDSVLRLPASPALDHVASPDVHVNPDGKVLWMYFHSVDDTTTWKQTTYLATSSDGLSFQPEPDPIGPPYMRVFRIGTTWWSVAKVRGGPGGLLLRSEDPRGPFHVGPRIIPGMRHAAVVVDGDIAHVFFSRIGDAPERLLVTSFEPKKRWIQMTEPEPVDVLRPELDYEGANLPLSASEVGEANEPVNSLRDPYIFTEYGAHYLFYSIAGESGIAVAGLTKKVGP